MGHHQSKSTLSFHGSVKAAKMRGKWMMEEYAKTEEKVGRSRSDLSPWIDCAM